jgi:hypothetical protein
LLSVNGNENALISLIFGAWLRRCTMTCDKVGLLCCGSLDTAIRAIAVASFHEFGRKIDYQAFAEQHDELQADTISRWGAWLGSEPYATTRIAALRRFMNSHAYATAEEWFLRERDEEPPALAAPGTATVSKADCAGLWRRSVAILIDLVVVVAIITSFSGGGSAAPARVTVDSSDSTGDDTPEPASSSGRLRSPAPSAAPRASASAAAAASTRATAAPGNGEDDSTTVMGPLRIEDNGAHRRPTVTLFGIPLQQRAFVDPTKSGGQILWFAIYMAVLTTVAGQSFGMMIAGLRVVTIDFQRPPVGRTLARYALVYLLWWLILPFAFFSRRMWLHDRWTKTRLVTVERVIARATGTT